MGDDGPTVLCTTLPPTADGRGGRRSALITWRLIPESVQQEANVPIGNVTQTKILSCA